MKKPIVVIATTLFVCCWAFECVEDNTDHMHVERKIVRCDSYCFRELRRSVGGSAVIRGCDHVPILSIKWFKHLLHYNKLPTDRCRQNGQSEYEVEDIQIRQDCCSADYCNGLRNMGLMTSYN